MRKRNQYVMRTLKLDSGNTVCRDSEWYYVGNAYDSICMTSKSEDGVLDYLSIMNGGITELDMGIGITFNRLKAEDTDMGSNTVCDLRSKVTSYLKESGIQYDAMMDDNAWMVGHLCMKGIHVKDRSGQWVLYHMAQATSSKSRIGGALFLTKEWLKPVHNMLSLGALEGKELVTSKVRTTLMLMASSSLGVKGLNVNDLQIVVTPEVELELNDVHINRPVPMESRDGVFDYGIEDIKDTVKITACDGDGIIDISSMLAILHMLDKHIELRDGHTVSEEGYTALRKAYREEYENDNIDLKAIPELAVQFRLPGFKGMLKAMDICALADELGVSELTDIYGNKYPITSDTDIIVNKSCFKMADWFNSLKEWYTAVDERYTQIGLPCFRICSSTHDKKPYTELAYMYSQTQDFADKDCLIRISDQVVDVFRKALNGDIAATKFMLGMYVSNQDNYAATMIQKAQEVLEIDNRMIYDKVVFNKIAELIKQKLKGISHGRISVEAKYQYLLSDPGLLLGKALFTESGIHYNPDVDGKIALLFRSPHIAPNELTKVQYAGGAYKQYLDRFLGHLSNCVIFNNLTTDAMNLGGACQ